MAPGKQGVGRRGKNTRIKGGIPDPVRLNAVARTAPALFFEAFSMG
jgi:hypothetical protein